MKILMTDDEGASLEDLKRAVKEVEPEAELRGFTSPYAALDYAEDEEPDVAFLDIEMGGIDGITLARMLKDIRPDVKIIFVTGYSQYAVDAFSIHASGYLLKPVSVSAVKKELTFAYGELPARNSGGAALYGKDIRIRTFGGFDIFVDGRELTFKRAKSKELLAYLVDRRGTSITTREACAILWEDSAYDTVKKNYFQIILMELKSALQKAGIEYILKKKRNFLAIDPSAFSCDSYAFMNGDIRAINNYRRDYMICYSWAEFSMGIMEDYGEKGRKEEGSFTR